MISAIVCLIPSPVLSHLCSVGTGIKLRGRGIAAPLELVLLLGLETEGGPLLLGDPGFSISEQHIRESYYTQSVLT